MICKHVFEVHIVKGQQLLFTFKVIKLFPETESMRGGTRLFFLAGDRVLKYLGKALDNERALTRMLR